MNVHLSISFIWYVFLSVLVINLLKIVNHLINGKGVGVIKGEWSLAIMSLLWKNVAGLASSSLVRAALVIRSHRADKRNML